MNNFIILDKKNFEIKKKEFIEGSSKKIQVISDFDRTLTKAFVNGEEIPSVISILRNYDYLNKEYSDKAKALANYYFKIEKDYSIPYESRKKAMKEWWTKHFDLLIKSELNKSHLERIVNEGKIHFRDNFFEFLDLLHYKNIPLIIISSNGIGDVIPMLLEKDNKLYDNIHIVTNLYKWNSKGKAISVKKPFIHSMNKDETSIKKFKFYDNIKNRKNVLLLGDSLDDLKMIKGFDYNSLISVGFLNYKTQENLELYKKNFDILIPDDGNFKEINKFIKEIK
jgi:cytosolic 5'-nucleotidase 3